MKACTKCRLEKEPHEFNWINKAKGYRNPVCVECSSQDARWPAESYRRVHNFSPVEEYIIEKLAAKPTLAGALDSLYRRSPRRWHQVMVAATLTRKEAGNVAAQSA